MSYKRKEELVKTVSHEIAMSGAEFREMLQEKYPEMRLPKRFPFQTTVPRPKFAGTDTSELTISSNVLIRIYWSEEEKEEVDSEEVERVE